MALRYALGCDGGHEFEAWFATCAAFDEQSAQGLITCPVCASGRVAKQVMAPFVGTARAQVSALPQEGMGQENAGQESPGQDIAGQETVPPEAQVQVQAQVLRDALRMLHSKLTENAENVGTRFAEEARKIHYEEAEARSIYGQASGEEVRELKEEGVEFVALPPLPDGLN